MKWITGNCEDEGADWEYNFPRFSLESVHCLQDGRHHADSAADEEIRQHVKLRHHDKHQHGSTKRHQTLNDQDLEKKHRARCWHPVFLKITSGKIQVSLWLLRKIKLQLLKKKKINIKDSFFEVNFCKYCLI